MRDIDHDGVDRIIVQANISLASNLGLHAIAEGAETAEQRDFLARNGCHAYQAYVFSCPLPRRLNVKVKAKSWDRFPCFIESNGALVCMRQRRIKHSHAAADWSAIT